MSTSAGTDPLSVYISAGGSNPGSDSCGGRLALRADRQRRLRAVTLFALALEAFLGEIVGALQTQPEDFRRKGSWEGQRCRRLDRGAERLQREKPDPACLVCSGRTYWCLSDIDPFLDRTA